MLINQDEIRATKNAINQAIAEQRYDDISDGYFQLAQLYKREKQEEMALNALLLSEAIVKKNKLGLGRIFRIRLKVFVIKARLKEMSNIPSVIRVKECSEFDRKKNRKSSNRKSDLW